MAHGGSIVRLTLIDEYLKQQREPTAVERFAREHDAHPGASGYYRELIPLTKPGPGEQFAFQVDLDRCTSCKACVTACHSMNGLDEHETWRFVGHLHGGTPSAPVQQAVTTACHHCIDPACLSGCPVKAYDKDPVTGIVKHLDDQCIGCQYCTLTCPYDVPQYSERKGIVRKCDMCSDRLAAGEAPACVQACPNEAISIRIVSQAAVLEDALGEPFLPGAPSQGITAPTTSFKSERALPRNTLPVDFHSVRPAHRHTPLVVMLVFMQLAVGMFCLEQLLTPLLSDAVNATFRPLQTLVALALALAGLGASIFHLGRPLYAFRAFLGLRTSWMSREVLVFGAFAGAAQAYTALVWRSQLNALAGFELVPESLARAIEPATGLATVATGLAGVICSVMIYHVTRRRFWNLRDTALKFFGTALVAGLATTLSIASWIGVPLQVLVAIAVALIAGTLLKLAGELAILRQLPAAAGAEDLARSALLLTTDLKRTFIVRGALAAIGGVLLPGLCILLLTAAGGRGVDLVAALSVIAITAGELFERALFFAAVSAPRMPGGLR